MSRWIFKVKLKHLFTEEEDYEAISKSMAAIADVLESNRIYFRGFDFNRFRKIPEGDDVISSCDYANKLLGRLYDYADAHRIWIE